MNDEKEKKTIQIVLKWIFDNIWSMLLFFGAGTIGSIILFAKEKLSDLETSIGLHPKKALIITSIIIIAFLVLLGFFFFVLNSKKELKKQLQKAQNKLNAEPIYKYGIAWDKNFNPLCPKHLIALIEKDDHSLHCESCKKIYYPYNEDGWILKTRSIIKSFQTNKDCIEKIFLNINKVERRDLFLNVNWDGNQIPHCTSCDSELHNTEIEYQYYCPKCVKNISLIDSSGKKYYRDSVIAWMRDKNPLKEYEPPSFSLYGELIDKDFQP